MAEKEIAAAIKSFLEVRGWRVIRTQFVAVVGMVSTLEPGIPDYCVVRYMPQEHAPCRALVFWIETKSPTDKRKCDCMARAIKAAKLSKRKPGLCKVCRQRNWADKERAAGGCVFDDVSSYDRFVATYEKLFGWLHRDQPAASRTGQMDLIE